MGLLVHVLILPGSSCSLGQLRHAEQPPDSGAYSLGSVKKYNILSLSIYTYKCLIFPFLFNNSFSIKNTISEKMISGPSRGSLVTQKNRVTYIAFDVKRSMMHKNVSLMSRYQ